MVKYLSLDKDFDLDKNKKHSVEVVVDRLVIRSDEDFKRRLADSVETALELRRRNCGCILHGRKWEIN